MKISTLTFVLIIIAALLIGVGIEYYGRTCPACQRRKKAIEDAVNGNGNGNGSEVDTTPVDIVDVVAPLPVGLQPITPIFKPLY